METQLSLFDSAWCDRMAPVVLSAMRGREFTSDDIHGVVDPPENVNLYGILFAKIRPQLERIGYRASKRPARNGAVVRIWRVK